MGNFKRLITFFDHMGPHSLSLLFLTLLITGCEDRPPPPLSMATVEWATYSNEQVGYTVQYPAAFTLQNSSNGRDLQLRHDGFPVIVINYTTRQEAEGRGLWADHEPVGDVELAGKTGKKYVYNHYDGPFYMRTHSYVIEHNDRFLAVEFRTKSNSADSLQQHILQSFSLAR